MAYGHKPCSLSTKYVIQSLRQSRYSGINTNTGCMESMGIQNMQSMRMPALVGCRKYSVDVLFKHSCCSPQAGTAVGCPIHCKQLQLITLILTVSMNGSSPERWSEASIKSLNPRSAECPLAPADPQWLGLAGWGWYMARADKILIHKLMMPPPTTVLIPSPSLSFSPSLPLSLYGVYIEAVQRPSWYLATLRGNIVTHSYVMLTLITATANLQGSFPLSVLQFLNTIQVIYRISWKLRDGLQCDCCRMRR